jgi:hypothetical protein
MSWYHGWPLSRYRTAGLLLVILLLVSLDAHIGAQALLPQPAASATASTSSPTPDLTATADTPSPTCEPSTTTATPSPTPDLTATAATPSPSPDLTATADTPSPTCEPSTTTATPSPTVDPNQLTPSISAAALITNTTPTETPISSPSATSSATSSATPFVTATPLPTTRSAPLQTPTPIPTPSDGVICPPETEIVFTGEGPPRAALLLAFEQRIVGGGSTDAGGRFRIPLAVGNERPGYYIVTVHVRGIKQVLRQWTCIVPEFAPTSAPAEFISTATQSPEPAN